MKLNLKIPICFFDLETTGINVSHDRIVDIAVIKLMPNGEKLKKHNLVNPEIKIPEEATAIHKITNEMVKDKPTFKEIGKEYARFLEGSDLSGFNILKFDIPLLVEEFLRAGIEFDYSRKRIIDSQKVFYLMEKRNLSSAYQFYCNEILEEAHSAEADTEAAMDVLIAQIQRYNNQEVTDLSGKLLGTIQNDMEVLNKLTTSSMIDLSGRFVINQKGEEVFNFGKHKGKLVSAVLRQEPSYYQWMMNGGFTLDTKRHLTEMKLRMLNK